MATKTTKLYLGSTLILDLTTFALGADLTSHTGNNTAHITSAERTSWNAKAEAVTLTTHTGNAVIHMTAAERTAWNAKLDASALTPYATQSWTTTQLAAYAKTADLTASYYTKTQADTAVTATLASYATQNWVTQQIAAKHHIQFTPVDTLPATGTPDVIYLLALTGNTSLREQYIWMDGKWVQIGDTGVSLAGYATETWVTSQLKTYAKTTDLNTAVASAKSEAKTEAVASAKQYADTTFARIVYLTLAQYDALTEKNTNTFYIIHD